MQAQGWPLATIAGWLGYGDGVIPFMDDSADIPADLDAAVLVVYTRIEDRQGPCPAAAEEARSLGFYPSIHYGDDMFLVREVPGDPEKARRCLAIMALTARGVETPDIIGVLALGDGGEKQVQRAREQIGLRLHVNLATLDQNRVMPGQDVLLREIRRYTRDIYPWDITDAADAPGLDYEALWNALCDVADLLHGAGEAGVPVNDWERPLSDTPRAKRARRAKTDRRLAATQPVAAA